MGQYGNEEWQRARLREVNAAADANALKTANELIMRADFYPVNGQQLEDRTVPLHEAAAVARLYRDIFNEINAKAIPFLMDPRDPERIMSYIVPCGPIHRAAGALGHQMFNGEAHLAAAIARIAELEAELKRKG